MLFIFLQPLNFTKICAYTHFRTTISYKLRSKTGSGLNEVTSFYIKVKQCKNTINECFFANKIARLPTHVQRFPRFCPHKIDHSIRPSYHFTTILNDKDASKPVARHLNLPNHSKQHMAVCGLSLHQGSSESRKTLSNPHGINERFLFN